MKLIKGGAIFGVVLGTALLLGAEAEADGGCPLKVEVINALKVDVRLTKAELGGATGYVSKWEGDRLIASGSSDTKTLSTGQTCTDGAGNPRSWNVRFTRKNGVQHTCTGLKRDARVKLLKGGGCSVAD